MKTKLALLALVGSLAFGSENAFLPYGGVINYSGSTTRDKGNVLGMYMSSYGAPYKTELDLGHTTISYNDGSPDLKQTDFTGIIDCYQGYNWVYKGGIHYISSDDSLTNKGKIFIAGATYYKANKYNMGMDVYYSDYDNESDSPKVWQFTPKAGISFGQYNSDLGSFYAEVKLDYINLTQSVTTTKTVGNIMTNTTTTTTTTFKGSYASSQISLSNYKGAFTTSVAFWGGERVYAVDNGGFVVNNLSDKQKGGFKFSEAYKINNKSSVKFEYVYTKFDGELGNSQSKLFSVSYVSGF
jgi:hypothetical protein